MKLISKKVLLASAAVAMMGAATPAFAFDTVNWEWNKLIEENILKDVTVTINVEPTGMTEIEKKQDFIGDVTATSTVTNVSNNPPGELSGDGIVLVEDFFAIHTLTDDSTDPTTIDPAPAVFGSELALQVELLGGTLDEGSDELDMLFRVFGEVDISEFLQAGELDAIDLPKVESFATAVGNNQDIYSTTSIQLHDGQFLWGDFIADEDPAVAASNLSTLLSFTPNLGNTHTSGAAYLTFAGALGMIAPSSISATSTVTSILNASVDSDATAVANNMSVELEAFTPDDALLIADITQYAYADVSATSLVDDVTVNNYTGFGAAGMGPCGGCELGDVQIPLVSSTATAVGNNLSVRVSSPSL